MKRCWRSTRTCWVPQQGLAAAQARAQLDQRLEQALARADRFNDMAIAGPAQQLVDEAAAVPAPGPVLRGQIERLKAQLAVAAQPVAVQFESDNQTTVVIYKVGKLGTFSSRTAGAAAWPLCRGGHARWLPRCPAQHPGGSGWQHATRGDPLRGSDLSPAIVVHDASGTRRFGEADLPLRIGTGPAAAIRLPGPVADQSHALMGLLDGRPFLQPTGTRVMVNEVPLSGTRWLVDGDEIGIGSARIRCAFSTDVLEFRLRFSGVDYDTLPPEAEVPEAAAATAAAGDKCAPAAGSAQARVRAALADAGDLGGAARAGRVCLLVTDFARRADRRGSGCRGCRCAGRA